MSVVEEPRIVSFNCWEMAWRAVFTDILKYQKCPRQKIQWFSRSYIVLSMEKVMQVFSINLYQNTFREPLIWVMDERIYLHKLLHNFAWRTHKRRKTVRLWSTLGWEELSALRFGRFTTRRFILVTAMRRNRNPMFRCLYYLHYLAPLALLLVYCDCFVMRRS
jgi:hypothetical protein